MFGVAAKAKFAPFGDFSATPDSCCADGSAQSVSVLANSKVQQCILRQQRSARSNTLQNPMLSAFQEVRTLQQRRRTDKIDSTSCHPPLLLPSSYDYNPTVATWFVQSTTGCPYDQYSPDRRTKRPNRETTSVVYPRPVQPPPDPNHQINQRRHQHRRQHHLRQHLPREQRADREDAPKGDRHEQQRIDDL